MVKSNTEKKPLKDQVIDSALALATEKKWSDVSFDDIITHANQERHAVLEYFDDKSDILVSFGRRVDKQMIESAALGILGGGQNIDENQSLIRERLFDLIMERFDILNENRDAILSILDSIKFDPKQALITFPHLGKSMGRILSEAGEDIDGISGCTKIIGLTGVYLYTVKSWMNDETADMAKTMATLDKALGLAEETANTLSSGDILGLFGSLKSNFTKD